jgi:cutinase
MKNFAPSLLPLALLLPTSFAAPAPASGVSFPITDLIDSNLTIAEYAAQLESQSPGAVEHSLNKRQYGSSTYNQLTDGTACRAVTVIYARGTTQDGNVGAPDVEGPTFFNALASRLGGTSRLAIQGVTYPADVFGFLAGGDAAGATTTFNLVNTVSEGSLISDKVVRTNHFVRPSPSALRPRSSSRDTARVVSLCTPLLRGCRRQQQPRSPQSSFSVVRGVQEQTACGACTDFLSRPRP